MFSCADWKTHTRNRIDISKNSLSAYVQVLRERAEDNHFVHMIFYNSQPEIVQIDEAKRRGLDAIFNSLRVVCAERAFVIQTITDDLCALENDIKKLFTYGSHHDLHLDELLFCRKRGWTHDQCTCGECSTSLVLENMPITANRFPPPVARRRSSSINAEEMPDAVSEIDVQNTGQIQIRVSHPRDRSSHVYTQGAENSNLLIHIPQQVENSSLLNTLGGRLSLSINLNMLFGLFRQLNLEEMNAVANERINLFPDDLSVIEHDDTYDNFLQNVPVLMSSDEYTNAVRIQSARGTKSKLFNLPSKNDGQLSTTGPVVRPNNVLRQYISRRMFKVLPLRGWSSKMPALSVRFTNADFVERTTMGRTRRGPY